MLSRRFPRVCKKAEPEDLLVRVTVHNRRPVAAVLHVLPTLRFRNTWSWEANAPRPLLRQTADGIVQVAREISRRLTRIFLRDADGYRPVYGGKKFQEDPHRRDYILFYEYFHGDNGASLGTSHQTGWTGVIARTLDLFARLTPEVALQTSKDELAARMTREQVAGG